jgi:uncharacterized protein YndB with AHSA1/START domain
MTTKPGTERRKITMERVFASSIDDVWELWTTKDGIESWWGPEGFRVEVRRMDLRAGGGLDYAMIAEKPEMIAFMERSGMPVVTEAHITYAEISPKTRLRYLHATNFVPGVEPYDVEHDVKIEQTASGVRMTLTIDAMHDEEWTKRAVMGWESEIGKLAKVLEASRN